MGQQGLRKRQEEHLWPDLLVLHPAGILLDAALSQAGPGYFGGNGRQLAGAAAYHPADQGRQDIQVPALMSIQILGVELLQGPSYGTIAQMAVTHGRLL